MIDPLQYLTMAARLRGYAEGLNDEYAAKYETLIHTLNKAAGLLEAVWDEHNQPDEKHGGTD
jgi:hypothetical protein